MFITKAMPERKMVLAGDIDRMGNPIYKARYAMVEPFYNGQARVETLAGELLVIDELGQVQQQLRASMSDDFAELSADMVGFWKTQTIATGVELGVVAWWPATWTTLAQSTDQYGIFKSITCGLGERLLFRGRGRK